MKVHVSIEIDLFHGARSINSPTRVTSRHFTIVKAWHYTHIVQTLYKHCSHIAQTLYTHYTHIVHTLYIPSIELILLRLRQVTLKTVRPLTIVQPMTIRTDPISRKPLLRDTERSSRWSCDGDGVRGSGGVVGSVGRSRLVQQGVVTWGLVDTTVSYCGGLLVSDIVLVWQEYWVGITDRKQRNILGSSVLAVC